MQGIRAFLHGTFSVTLKIDRGGASWLVFIQTMRRSSPKPDRLLKKIPLCWGFNPLVLVLVVVLDLCGFSSTKDEDDACGSCTLFLKQQATDPQLQASLPRAEVCAQKPNRTKNLERLSLGRDRS